jgi:hypothetical protein
MVVARPPYSAPSCPPSPTHALPTPVPVDPYPPRPPLPVAPHGATSCAPVSAAPHRRVTPPTHVVGFGLLQLRSPRQPLQHGRRQCHQLLVVHPRCGQNHVRRDVVARHERAQHVGRDSGHGLEVGDQRIAVRATVGSPREELRKGWGGGIVKHRMRCGRLGSELQPCKNPRALFSRSFIPVSGLPQTATCSTVQHLFPGLGTLPRYRIQRFGRAVAHQTVLVASLSRTPHSGCCAPPS